MSILSLFDIPDLLESIVNVIGKHVSDPGVMAEIKAQVASLTLPESAAQAGIEARDQTSPDKYIRYVRSTAEWICIYGLAMGVIVSPLLVMFGLPSPLLPMGLILNLLYALLGLGATRIAEGVFSK